MTDTDMNKLDTSNLTGEIEDFSVDSAVTDGATGQKETIYINKEWNEQFGYYKSIPELAAVIDAKATWTVGKGYITNGIQEYILQQVIGFGKDTFNTILENMIRTYHIGGDSFAEIILKPAEKNSPFVFNLKPLDPGTIKIVANSKGIIIRYEQISKTNKAIRKFKPEKILHLSRNRVADEIHGQSLIPKLKEIILARNEAMTNYKQVMNRYLKPRYIFHLDTDNPNTISTFKSKMDEAWRDGENIYVPKGGVVPEQMSIAPNSTLNPLAWIESLNNYFYEAAQVPKIILGGAGGFTEAAVKIAYLAFQQTIEEEQLYIEEELWNQLKLKINLEFPASLENEMLSDRPKGNQNAPQIEQENNAIEQNDLTAEMEGRK